MKNKYRFWKHCVISLIGLASLTECTRLTCDFTYSPNEARAGEIVTFSNRSTGADDYYWTFGDNSTSTATSPTHIYRKPGTYTVTLSIVRNKVEKRTSTQHITILDTIPTLAANVDTIHDFTPIKFYAKIYNPWHKTTRYVWNMPEDAVVLAGKSLDSSAIVCYFTQSSQTSKVELQLQIEDQQYDLTYPVNLQHRDAPSVLFYADEKAMEQYMYTIWQIARFSQAAVTQSAENIALLNNEQDSVYQYGDRRYTLTSVGNLLGQEIKGFQVDRLLAKIYAYGNGLWVCNITGEHQRQLISTPVQAIKVDGAGNRVYWATSTGLYMHSLISTSANSELFEPIQVNTYSSISRISINSNLH